jgi:flavin reductase (DIM6/NTAB) family NADH-FMN oxidoreductase RutF
LIVDKHHPNRAAPTDFRLAMRQLAGGVCIITAEDDAGRTGMTATSVISVSMDPPEVLLSVNEQSSTWPAIQSSRRLGINMLASDQTQLAANFSGVGGCKGEQRYQGAQWQRSPEGCWLLVGALAALACEVVQTLHHRGHALVIARVVGLQVRSADDEPLLYWQGEYRQLMASSALKMAAVVAAVEG